MLYDSVCILVTVERKTASEIYELLELLIKSWRAYFLTFSPLVLTYPLRTALFRARRRLRKETSLIKASRPPDYTGLKLSSTYTTRYFLLLQ